MRTYDPTALPDHPVRVTPAGLAGPGEPGMVFAVLEAAGWSVTVDPYHNRYAWSPDRLAYVGWEPEGWADAMPVPQDTLWVVVCFREVGKRTWTSTFDDHTPAELIEALVLRLVDADGLVRDPRNPAELLQPPATTATYTDPEAPTTDKEKAAQPNKGTAAAAKGKDATAAS